MTNILTYLQAIELILREVGQPLAAQDLVNEIRKQRLIDSDYKTQFKTVNARLSVDIRNNGEKSIFKRVIIDDKIFYTLRESPGQEYLPEPHRRRLSDKDRVLVFNTSKLDELGHFHGIRMDFEKYEQGLLSGEAPFFMNRLEAEADNKYKYKQIVSYIIIKYKSYLLRYTRGVITNIGRYLHGEYSLGFGGHVEERPDWELPLLTPDYGYLNSIKRELKQEISIDIDNIPKYDLKTIGVLNDDSSKLGRRHFAFIHLLHIKKIPEGERDFFKKGEKSINSPQLVKIKDISKEFSGYEYWSKLCLQTFYSNALAFECHIHAKPNFLIKKRQTLILIVGYIGSGKSEACKLLASEFGYTLVPCSKILVKELDCEPMEKIGRPKLQELGLNFISQPNGHRKLAKAIAKYMKTNPGNKFVFDGLRYPKTLKELEKQLGNKITVIYVESTIDNLFKYYVKRKHEGDKKREFSDFLKVVYHPVEREIERFRPIADITIYNHASKGAYLQRLQEFFREELTNDKSLG